MEAEKSEKKKAVGRSKEEEKEEEDDCYVIDPIDSFLQLRITDDSDDDDVILVGVKGPVALRDFPHPRHLCANFPFNSTAHASYCGKCFCYVCEVPAPCLKWYGYERHCSSAPKKTQSKKAHL